MGDRGNIYIRENRDSEYGIYFYTHWRGSDLKKILQDALKKQWRWYDEAYLNRIIFCELVKHDISGETGYGISLYKQDNEHPIVQVFTDSNEVEIGGTSWTFNEYIKQKF